jgi:hypothetical protein
MLDEQPPIVTCLADLSMKLTCIPIVPVQHHIVSLAGAVFGIATALVGLVGIIRENRLWLSYYTIVLWPGFALYIAVGYITFRRAKMHLRAHIKDEWIFSYTREQRLIVQRNVRLFVASF